MLDRAAKHVGVASINQEDLFMLRGLLGSDYILRVMENGPGACGKVLVSLIEKNVDEHNSPLNCMNGKQWGGKGNLVEDYARHFVEGD